ncbi:MAG: GNAT family N-acetyltransferase [Longimicrobiales bacterium]
MIRPDGLETRPVAGRADLDRFIKLPWRIYHNDSAWVPPLLQEVRQALDRSRHPFHDHAQVEYFLAIKNAEIVGRIAAIVNRAHNEFHDDQIGFFGLFECINDAGVAQQLLTLAEDWLRARGCSCARGPMNFSTNEEICSPGVLVDGFAVPPRILMGHSPPYYPRLLESAGYVKAKDLLAYWVDADQTPERMMRGLGRLRRQGEITLRQLNLRDFAGEVSRVKEIYNEAWERNWGFVPMTDQEVDHMAKSLRPVIDPKLCFFAEHDGSPVGFALAVPDYNQALKYVNGRLFPVGVFKFLWHRRGIKSVRTLTLGVKQAYRQRGLDVMLIVALMESAQKDNRARGECSWILEDNFPMRRGLERMGGRVYKTYRVFEKQLVV